MYFVDVSTYLYMFIKGGDFEMASDIKKPVTDDKDWMKLFEEACGGEPLSKNVKLGKCSIKIKVLTEADELNLLMNMPSSPSVLTQTRFQKFYTILYSIAEIDGYAVETNEERKRISEILMRSTSGILDSLWEAYMDLVQKYNKTLKIAMDEEKALEGSEEHPFSKTALKV